MFFLFQAGANKDERDVPEMQNSTMFWDSKLFRMKTVNIAHYGQKEKNMILDSQEFSWLKLQLQVKEEILLDLRRH